MFENKSLIFWQLVIWGYESKPACGSIWFNLGWSRILQMWFLFRSRWFEATVSGVSADVVLRCALLKFPTQQWDAQNWQDISMIFVETEISDDFSACRSYTKNGTLVHHWTFPRGRSPSPLPKPTSNLAAPSSWWFLPCFGCISVPEALAGFMRSHWKQTSFRSVESVWCDKHIANKHQECTGSPFCWVFCTCLGLAL